MRRAGGARSAAGQSTRLRPSATAFLPAGSLEPESSGDRKVAAGTTILCAPAIGVADAVNRHIGEVPAAKRSYPKECSQKAGLCGEIRRDGYIIRERP